MIMTACGSSDTGSKDEVTIIETNEESIADAIAANDIRHASTVADSLALMVDDLTPEQTAGVLSTFVDVVDRASAEGSSRKMLETMRKYVDVYDIGLSINPKDLKKILDSDRRHDYDSIASAYRSRLTDYAYTMSTEAPAKTTDTIATNTATDELPINLRPAE